MSSTIDNGDKVLDSRDIIRRIEELEGEKELVSDQEESARELYEETLRERINDGTDNEESADCDRLKEELEHAVERSEAWDHSDEAGELKALKLVADQCEGYGDWEHGEPLIHDRHFEAYAQEFAEDCGMVKDQDTWPNRCIDWTQAAEELKQDYMEVDFDGQAYWMRA